MSSEVEALRQLQAQLNASFETAYAAPNAKSLARAKEHLIDLSNLLTSELIGPVFSVIGLSGTPVYYMAIRIAIDLHIFEFVASKPCSLNELVQATNADSRILRRILRTVSSIGWLKQTQADKWEASPISKMAAVPAFGDWLRVHYDTRMRVYSEFPIWLKSHDYKTSWVSDTDNIFLDMNGKDCWSFMTDDPEYSARFDSAMSIQDSFPREMTPPYPFPTELSQGSTSANSVAIVDVGGGYGQALEAIKKTYPGLQGRFIVQDLPKTIESLDPERAQTIGFEAHVHNFFEEQPVRGAKYYHLRRVLHDWPDAMCLKILAALRPAMDPAYSKLLIVEFVLSDDRPVPAECQFDLMMMTTCNGAERTESEWYTLLEIAGFKIDQIMRADSGATAVLVASVA